jgi:ATP-dependent DNA helicase DinG
MATGVHMLAKGGRVAQRLPGYEIRPQQLEMAEAVAAAFKSEKHLLVEAGTGVGKSFAYLVPAIEQVTRAGGRVVISTHTIALQEQLVGKDIPFLRSVFPDEFSAVLVKGRSNYLGLRRLARASARQAQLFSSKKQRSELWKIEEWAYKTTDGSLADLPQQPGEQVWELARSDGDDCLGRKCPHFSRCFYQRARRRAANAQLLIVNHALLFSDMALRARGVSVLPRYDYVILDEAQTVERVAGEHLGLGVASTQVRFLLNRLHNERTGRGVLRGGPGRAAIPGVAQARKAADRYFGDLGLWYAQQTNFNGRLREPPPVKQDAAGELLGLRDRLRSVRGELQDEEDRSELAGLMGRCSELAKAIDSWHAQKEQGWVHWLEARDAPRPRVTLRARPIDVGPVLEAMLFGQVKSAVLTSATLTTAAQDPFGYLRGRVGLDEARGVALGSPFDYRKQLRVYVEAGLPDPSNAKAFIPAVCDAIKKYVRKTSGRAFVLFTSYDMLRRSAEALASFFEGERMPLLVQGSGMPRSLMLSKFRSVPRSVLFGTDTFWTGVDVPGEALSNVIIVKLPFAVPNEPIVEARIEKIRNEGGNPFMDFQIPEAILKFRQGVGRLIRSRNDKGIVVILDPRVTTKPYGRMFLKVLPNCEVVVER